MRLWWGKGGRLLGGGFGKALLFEREGFHAQENRLFDQIFM